MSRVSAMEVRPPFEACQRKAVIYALCAYERDHDLRCQMMKCSWLPLAGPHPTDGVSR